MCSVYLTLYLAHFYIQGGSSYGCCIMYGSKHFIISQATFVLNRCFHFTLYLSSTNLITPCTSTKTSFSIPKIRFNLGLISSLHAQNCPFCVCCILTKKNTIWEHPIAMNPWWHMGITFLTLSSVDKRAKWDNGNTVQKQISTCECVPAYERNLPSAFFSLLWNAVVFPAFLDYKKKIKYFNCSFLTIAFQLWQFRLAINMCPLLDKLPMDRSIG